MQDEHRKRMLAAVNAHRAGQIKPAQDAYLSLHAIYPREFDIVHLLGLTFLQTGNLPRAVALLSEAAALKPGSAAAHNNLANALKASGKLEPALASYGRALAIQPQFPEARFNAGNTRAALGDAAGAIADYDGVLALQPDHVPALLAKGSLLRATGQREQALRLLDKAVALNPRLPEALALRGTLRLDLDRPADALEDLTRALALKPGFPEALLAAGNCLRALGRPEEAIARYDKTIALRPDDPEAHSSRGTALKELGRLEDAVASQREAIRLRPDFAAAWRDLASTHSQAGRFAEAREAYERARALDPALLALVLDIVSITKVETGDPLFAEVGALLERDDLDTDTRMRLHHAYGKMCGDVGRHDDQIRHYGLGNRLIGTRFDMARHARDYAARKQVFTRDFFAARKSFGIADERPVFILGMPRSGTTLVEQVLASHHQVAGLGERPDLPNIIAEQCGGRDLTSAAVSLTAADVARMANRYCEAFRRVGSGVIRIIDKLPHNFEALGFIALMFPRAHIIHCRRDPLDTCVSMYLQTFSEEHGYNADLETLGTYYRHYEDLMTHWRDVLPLPIHDCAYEDMVRDFEPSVRSLLNFLGLGWDPNCLAYHRQDRQVATPSRWQVRQPLYDKSVGRWRLYEAHLGPLKAALGRG